MFSDFPFYWKKEHKNEPFSVYKVYNKDCTGATRGEKPKQFERKANEPNVNWFYKRKRRKEKGTTFLERQNIRQTDEQDQNATRKNSLFIYLVKLCTYQHEELSITTNEKDETINESTLQIYWVSG